MFQFSVQDALQHIFHSRTSLFHFVAGTDIRLGGPATSKGCCVGIRFQRFLLPGWHFFLRHIFRITMTVVLMFVRAVLMLLMIVGFFMVIMVFVPVLVFGVFVILVFVTFVVAMAVFMVFMFVLFVTVVLMFTVLVISTSMVAQEKRQQRNNNGWWKRHMAHDRQTRHSVSRKVTSTTNQTQPPLAADSLLGSFFFVPVFGVSVIGRALFVPVVVCVRILLGSGVVQQLFVQIFDFGPQRGNVTAHDDLLRCRQRIENLFDIVRKGRHHVFLIYYNVFRH